MKNTRKRQIDRRSFFKLLQDAGLGGSVFYEGANAQQAPQQAPQKVTKETLRAAEQLIGIELTDEQEAMALSGVNRNLASYEALRKIDVPLDTEPAIAFHPAPPGKKFNTTRS